MKAYAWIRKSGFMSTGIIVMASSQEKAEERAVRELVDKGETEDEARLWLQETLVLVLGPGNALVIDW